MNDKTQRPGEAEPVRPSDLAAEYLAARAAGEPVELARYLARSSDTAGRAEIERLVADAELAQRELPRLLSEGTLIAGQYRIQCEIAPGTGGMGRVFEAWDQRLERRVALKVLSSVHIGRREIEELFDRESRLLASLHHPNIVAVHDKGRDGDLAYIVMDLVDGTSLSDVIERARKELQAHTPSGPVIPRDGRLLERAIGKPLPGGRTNLVDADDWYASVARIMLELARTIESAHSVDVIHRDIKPGNVMLLGGGNPVVLDFGLAGSITMTQGVVTQGLYGSFAYLAPEQAQSNTVGVDPRTDVYQLGLLLYEMLTLRRAFPGTDIGTVLAHVKDGAFPRPRQLNPAAPRDLESICMMALELDPARRYASARALREDLERYVDGREAPIAVRSERWRSISRTSRYFLRRHRWRVAAAATVVIGVSVWFAKGHMDDSNAGPPLIAAFRLPNDGKRWSPIAEGDSVYPGDVLGVTISTSQPQCLYALSTFRRADKSLFFNPMRPATSEEFHAGKKGLPFGKELERGKSDVMCTRLDLGPPDKINEFEGLLVITAPSRRADVESWLAQLDAMKLAHDPWGVPAEEAWKALEEPPPMRGGDQSDLLPEERARYARDLHTAFDTDGELVEFPGLRALKLECRVSKPK
jgi:serine/threonine protein kinase